MKTTHTIKITQTGDHWSATTLGGHEADEVFRLFGTYTLPTAYMIGTDISVVMAAISRLNPMALVL